MGNHINMSWKVRLLGVSVFTGLHDALECVISLSVPGLLTAGRRLVYAPRRKGTEMYDKGTHEKAADAARKDGHYEYRESSHSHG